MNNYNVEQNQDIVIQLISIKLMIINNQILSITYVLHMDFIRWLNCSRRNKSNITLFSHDVKCIVYIYGQTTRNRTTKRVGLALLSYADIDAQRIIQ